MQEKENLTSSTLQLVRDAKKTVHEAIESSNKDQLKFLERLSTCVEKIEGDLITLVLDEKIAKLREYKRELENVNKEIQQDVKQLKAVSDKVAMAGEALGKLIDIIDKATSLPGL